MASILVIEDDGIVREALFKLLTRAGHSVSCAADGGNGVQAYKLQRPDLVILDRNLPVLSGSGVFARIMDFDRAARVIMLSGYDDPQEMARYLKGGAAAFLSKEDGISNVLGAVEAVLGPAGAGAARRAPLALVADDEKIMRGLLKRTLEEAGCRVIEAADGAQAVRLALEHKPDIVMLDVVMPKENGMDALRALLPRLPGTAFLLVTGHGEEESAREALRLGAMDYICKPFNPDTLKAAVAARLLLQGKIV